MTAVEPTKHQGGSGPMEQFILLAKGTKGMAAAELVKQALEAPALYVFSELMDVPNIKELKGGDQNGTWELLSIFAYGTFKDYLSSKTDLNLPELSVAQAKKLKHLTVVSLSEKDKRIPYSTLQEQLSIGDIRELEDLIIEAIYAEIIRGKLDQKNAFLEVDSTIGRDIRPEHVNTIVNTLEAWCDACENVLGSLQNQMDRATAERISRMQRKEQLEQEISNLKKTVKAHPVDSEEMLVDSREGAVERTPAKKSVKKGGGLRGSSKLFK